MKSGSQGEEHHKMDTSEILIIVLIVSFTVVGAITVSLLYLWFCHRKTSPKSHQNEELTSSKSHRKQEFSSGTFCFINTHFKFHSSNLWVSLDFHLLCSFFEITWRGFQLPSLWMNNHLQQYPYPLIKFEDFIWLPIKLCSYFIPLILLVWFRYVESLNELQFGEIPISIPFHQNP